MSLLATTSRIGFGAVLAAALSTATMTAAPKPANAHVSVWFGYAAPGWAAVPGGYYYPPAYYPPRAYWRWRHHRWCNWHPYRCHGARWWRHHRGDWDDDD